MILYPLSFYAHMKFSSAVEVLLFYFAAVQRPLARNSEFKFDMHDPLRIFNNTDRTLTTAILF